MHACIFTKLNDSWYSLQSDILGTRFENLEESWDDLVETRILEGKAYGGGSRLNYFNLKQLMLQKRGQY